MKPVNEKEFNAASKEPVAEKVVEEGLLEPTMKIKSDSGEVTVDIEKFIKFGTITKSIKIADMSISIKTLTSKEKDEALGTIQTKQDETIMEYLKKAKYPLLAYSIVKINDTAFDTSAHKTMLIEYLNNSQGVIVDKLWDEYETLVQEQTELLTNAELKKN